VEFTDNEDEMMKKGVRTPFTLYDAYRTLRLAQNNLRNKFGNIKYVTPRDDIIVLDWQAYHDFLMIL